MPYDRKRIADAIDRIAEREGLSINAWAKAAGLVPGTFRAIREGRTKSIALQTIYKMADGAGVPVWEVLGEDVPWKAEYEDLRATVARMEEFEAARNEALREALNKGPLPTYPRLVRPEPE